MKTIIIIAIALVVCVGVYFVGYRAGTKKSLIEADRRNLVVLTLGMYDAAEATNWTKVRSFINTELYGFTRDYERDFGVPSDTDRFASRFARAKVAADQIERGMVPLSSMMTNPAIATNLGSNATIRMRKEKR